MANVQVSDFPEKLTPVDDDVVHLKGNLDNGDYKTKISSLKTVVVTNQIATNAEAAAGVLDTKIMTPVKTQHFYTNRISSQAQAEAGSDNTTTMTPLRVDQYAQANQPYNDLETLIITVNTSLLLNKYYLCSSNSTHTLPNVTGFTGGEKVRLNKLAVNEPTIQREGTNGEQIRLILGNVLDTSVIYDIDSEITFTYNSSTNEWEV